MASTAKSSAHSSLWPKASLRRTVADLVELVSTAPRRTLVGTGFRQQSPAYDPLSGEGARIHGGRFNPANSFPVLYICSTPACAAAELTRFATSHPIGLSGFLPRTLWRYQINLTNVLDLTESETLDHLGLEPAELVDHDRMLTHQIGEVAHQFGYQAIRNASAAGVDDVIAVFIENLRSGVLSPSEDEAWNDVADLPIF